MEEVFIVSAVRTPIGAFNGMLSGFTATELGSLVIAEAICGPASPRNRWMKSSWAMSSPGVWDRIPPGKPC